MIAGLRARLDAGGFIGSRKGVLSLIGTLGARSIAAVGGIYFSIVIAGIGGTEGLGVVTFILSLILIASLLFRFGTDQSLIRYAASYRAMGRPYVMLSIFSRTVIACFSFAVGSAGVAWIILPSVVTGEMLDISRLLLWTLPPFTIVYVASGYLKGMKHSAAGSLAEFGAITGVSAVVIKFLNINQLAQALNVVLALAWIVGAGVVLVCLSIARRQCAEVSGDDEQPFEIISFTRYLMSGYPFTIIGLSLLATQAGSFAIAGFVLSDFEVGQLRAAERIALIISFGLTAINPFIAPRISAAWVRSGGAAVRLAYRRAVLASILCALPMTFAVVFGGRWMLDIFGPEFSNAYPLLLIMTVGQLVHACMGSLNMVITMTGRERVSMWISLLVLVVGSLALLLGARVMGAYGFAIAYSGTMVIRELLMLSNVRRMLTKD